MTLARDSRMDRRRRVLLDASNTEQAEGNSRQQTAIALEGEANQKKSTAYSQDVRQACSTRLVQLIPVRKRSFIALIALNLLIAATLVTAHYLIYVNGYLEWYGHPLAIALDASHPQSIAAWLGSHLWLLCLATTILTFQLRRHKLDDYNGEYRLWFWLVITCLIASIDSTTRLTDMFSLALDKWTKVNMGWSGKAVVVTTMTTLVRVLGLRLISELKSVPLSLLCWLTGLASWAYSTALAQESFRASMELQTRIWLRSSLWLIGLTLIWIAALAYLRHVYLQAQRRFLARGLLARRGANASMSDRLRQTIPFRSRADQGEADDLRQEPAGGWRRFFGRRRSTVAIEQQPTKSRRSGKAKPAETNTPATPSSTIAGPINKPASSNSASPQAATAQATSGQSAPGPLAGLHRASGTAASTPPRPGTASTNPTVNKTPSHKTEPVSAPDSSTQVRRWPFNLKLWPGKAVPEELPTEYMKLAGKQAAEQLDQRQAIQDQRKAAQAERQAAKEARAAERAAAKQAKRDRRHVAGDGGGSSGWGRKLIAPVTAVGGVLSMIKMPSLSAFKLSPPESDHQPEADSPTPTFRPVSDSKTLPGTTRPADLSNNGYRDEDEDDDRQMSKAERKKLRRQNRAA